MSEAGCLNRFIDTPISQQIAATIAWSMSRPVPVLITGAAGIGKTTTFERIALETQSIKVMGAMPATGRLKPTLTTIASLFGVWVEGKATYDVQEALLNSLPYDQADFLIVDKAQHLEPDSLRSVLFLHDKTGLPIAFVGNPTVLKRVRGKAAAFDQISDRLGRTVHLAGIGERDIMAFGVEYNVQGREAYALLGRVGVKTSLRQLSRLLQEARLIAGAVAVQLHHLEDALSYLYGVDGARTLLSDRRAMA